MCLAFLGRDKRDRFYHLIHHELIHHELIHHELIHQQDNCQPTRLTVHSVKRCLRDIWKKEKILRLTSKICSVKKDFFDESLKKQKQDF
jgi:hypothetical protein